MLGLVNTIPDIWISQMGNSSHFKAKEIMTSQETSKKVKSMIKSDFGMSFTNLKKEIMKTLDCPGSSSDHFKSKRGYSIFYTDNSNYMQGSRNGGGKGFFASLQGIGSCSVVKL